MKKLSDSLQGIKRLRVLTVILIAVILIGISISLLVFPVSWEERADYSRLSSESYDTVFLSMFPIDTYEEEDFTFWRGLDTVITSHEISNQFILKRYLNVIQKSGNNVSDIYLGVKPEELSGAEFTELLSEYPQITFHVILAYPSLSYWTSLSLEKCDQILQAYRDFVPYLLEQENISAFFFGSSQWLIANPEMYETDFLTVPETSLRIMLNCNDGNIYWLTDENAMASIDVLESLIENGRNDPREYIDLTEQTMVFFGDSVIGNFTDLTSVPGVTGTLTGAKTYNLGCGGTLATWAESAACCMTRVVDAFVQEDLSMLPDDSQSWLGLKEYLSDGAAAPYCIVINYGLNDYYNGAPVSGDDLSDISTFCGAYRYAVQELREKFPDSRIILTTPNFTTYFHNGMDYMSEYNHTIVDYVDALISLADELNVELLDNYNEMGIDADNHINFLSDGCHPNENGRFLMAERIARKLSE